MRNNVLGTYVVARAEERALAERFALLPLTPFSTRGLLGWRHVVSCRWRYDNAAQSERPGKELFRLLTPLRERAAEIAGVPVQSLRQVLVTEYPPGAVMGWHRDQLIFDDVVALSLLTPCTLRFRRRLEEGWERRSIEVMPRSAYLLRGPARRDWQHSTAPVGELRFLVTFAISP